MSIISSCFNVARFLPEAMDSVLNQTFTGWEYIIVDDGSTDTTVDVARRYAARDPRIKIVSRPNGGVAAARNTGVRASNPASAYMIWFDGDDVLEPKALEVLVAYLDRNPQVGAVLCNRQHIDEVGAAILPGWRPVRWMPGRLFPRPIDDSDPRTPFSTLFVQDAVTNPSSTLVRRTAYDQTPGWDETLGPFEDWDLVFRIALTSEFHYIPERLVQYRVGRAGQATSRADAGRRKYRQLYAMWSRYQGVPENQIPIVESAIRFREGRALPLQRFGWAQQHLRRGELPLAARLAAQSAAAFGAYVLRSCTGQYTRHRGRSAAART